MDKVIKRKWLKALRSGKYKQCCGQLRYIDNEGNSSYCCLGVLCDVIDPKGWKREKHRRREILPDGSVAEEAGIPKRGDDDLFDDLTSMNDVDEKSFKQIANWIEKHL